MFWSYTELIVGEVACFGYTELDTDRREVYVPEIFLVPQTASASEVDFMTEGLPYAIEKALMDGRIEDLRFCIHSHGEFGAQWSQTDEDMIRKIGSTGTPWFASAIFNKKGARTGRIDIFGDTPFGRTQHTMKDLAVEQERGWEYDAARCEELDHFVQKPAPPAPKNAVKQIAQSTSKDEKPKAGPVVTMTTDSIITINGVDVDLDELPAHALMSMAAQLGWEFADDCTGTRYYYDMDSEFFYEAKQFGRSYTDTDAENEDDIVEAIESESAQHAFEVAI
jgi:hypothetical protein